MAHETKNDIIQIIILNVGALGFSFTDVEQALKIIALSLTIIYTLFKFYKDLKKK